MRPLRIVGMLFLATSCCESSKAASPDSKSETPFYEITGTVDVTAYLWRTPEATGSVPQSKWSFGFKCISGTNLWRIENTAAENGIERMFCDGTNMYQYLRQTGPARDIFNGHPPLGTPLSVPYSPTNDSVTINIFPGTIPSKDVGIGIPWLAFCSGPTLRSPNHVIPLPSGPTGLPDALAYADKSQCFNDDLGLPKTLNLLTSAERYRKSLMDRPAWDYWRMRAQTNFHITHPDGEVRFHYEVSSTTNIAGHVFPIEFHYSDFARDGSNRWHLQSTGIGKVLSIRESAKPQNVFEPGRRQGIIDWRFCSQNEPVNAIQYESREMVEASPINDPALQELFASAKLKARIDGAKAWSDPAGASVEKPAGVGVSLGVDGQDIIIRGKLPDSPAGVEKDLHIGDKIIAVAQDNEPAVPLQDVKLLQAINLIRGPKDTTVHLTVVHPGEDDSRARSVSLVRRELKELSAGVNNGLLSKGMKAPNIPMVDVANGTQERLSNYAGKIVVLEFWATWCGPCQKAMADLQTYSAKHPEWSGHVVLIAASVDDNVDTIRNHLRANGWDQTHNVWIESSALKAFQVDAVPTAYVIDPQGKIFAAAPADIPETVNHVLEN